MLIRISLLTLFVTAVGPLSARDPCEEAEGYLSAGELHHAADRLQDCIRLRPDALPAYLQLCAVYQQLGDSERLSAGGFKNRLTRFFDPAASTLAALRSLREGSRDSGSKTSCAATIFATAVPFVSYSSSFTRAIWSSTGLMKTSTIRA